MSTQIQRRRGTTAQHASFTGAVGETTIDTDKEVVVVHDGVQVGGYPQMRENGSNSALALGSAGTPSLKFTGDPNTGIYSPGADQVAISTGGSGRLFVDSSGRIGIGASSPGVPLDITTVNATANLRITDSTNGAKIKLVAASTEFDLFNTGGAGWLGTATNSPLLLATNGTEKLRITSAGLVGIGSSSPQTLLELAGNGTAIVRTTNDNPGIGQDALIGGYEFYKADASGSGAGVVGAVRMRSADSVGSSAYMTFSTALGGTANDVERVRITGAGNVGIGTTAPGYNLEIIGGSSTLAKIGDNSNQNFLAGVESGVPVIYAATSSGAALPLAFKTGATERARIDSSGRLLVGTSSAPSNGELLRVTKASSGTEGAAINLFGEYTLADDASQTITLPHAALIMVTDQTTGRAGLLFATYDSATITTVSDPSNIIATSDTDTKLCVFKSAATNNITVKNRLGATRNIGVGKITIL